jgi:demethylmenaquinone methyltransferase/2-methoxy-6-polyprenyl-1,4-benzoquinol methylase
MTARQPSDSPGPSEAAGDSPSAEGGRTHFGYREVEEADKPSLVKGVFQSVAGRYDLMNDLMSGGVHRLCKNAMVDWLNPRPGLKLLDTAGGTGDIAFRVLDRLQPGQGHVIVCDLTAEMLAVGRDRAIDRGLLKGLSWVCGDAERLPLPDRSVTAYTIAFGLRNVTHIDRALAEARRVLKPGGRFLCLEFSQIVLPLLDRFYDAYSFAVLPRLGALVAGDADSYRYLAESIRRFPAQPALARLIAEAGLARPRWENLSGGIAAIHSAWRI